MQSLSVTEWFRTFLDPDNPFVPWIPIMLLSLLLIHLAVTYWVYRDALSRYNRGAPWALLSMIFPLGGWLFYIMYRASGLVQYDRIEAELFDEDEHEWTDYDQYKVDRSKQLFKELSSVIRNPEASGYSPWVRMARLREQRRKLTPEERAEAREIRSQRQKEKRKQRALSKAERREKRKQEAAASREKKYVTGLHGARLKLSLGRQKKIKKQLSLSEQLKGLPREDQLLEDLIYEGDYPAALQAARDSLEIAREMHDRQGIVTYQTYIKRLERLLRAATQDDAEPPESAADNDG